MALTWHNQKVSWDPSNYGGHHRVFVSEDADNWLPDLGQLQYLPEEERRVGGGGLTSGSMVFDVPPLVLIYDSHFWLTTKIFEGISGCIVYSNRSCV